MALILSFVLATLGSLSATASIIHCQAQSTSVNQRSKSRRPSVTVIRQQSSPVTLKISSVESIPGKTGLVKITIKAQGASTVKGFHFHYEETFVDVHGAAGSVVTNSTSLRSLPHEESFIARENGEVEIWVSEVEFLDGSTWKSSLIPKLKRDPEKAAINRD